MESRSWSNRKATWKGEGFINRMANSIQLLVELVKHTLIAQGEPRCLMNCSALLCLVLCTRVAGCCLPCCSAGQRHFPYLALCLAFLAVLHRRCSPLPNSPAVADLGCAGFAPAWFAKAMQVQESVSRRTLPGPQAMFAPHFQKVIAVKHWRINGHVPHLQHSGQTIRCDGDTYIFRARGQRNTGSGKLIANFLRSQRIITPSAALFTVQSPSVGSSGCFPPSSMEAVEQRTGLCERQAVPRACLPVRGEWLANLLGLWNFPTQILLILRLQ